MGVRTFERYLDDIGRERLLTRSEELSLAASSRAGDEAARRRLVSANLRFVVAAARRYRGMGVPMSDLVNEGNLGLLRAAERFDETRGVRFVTYAAWWVRQAMFRAVERQQRWAVEGGPVSIDAPAADPRGACVGEMLADDQEPPDVRVEQADLKRTVDQSLTGLPERESLVLRLYYGLDDGVPRSVGEIGARLDISRVRVRRLRDRGLARLRESSDRAGLSAHAGVRERSGVLN